jgi:hypothetical protein
VIDDLERVGASPPSNWALNGPLVWIDNMNPNATFAHGVIVLNGRSASSACLLKTMSYQLERAFGRILGLDFSQVNDNAVNLAATEPNCKARPGSYRQAVRPPPTPAETPRRH